MLVVVDKDVAEGAPKDRYGARLGDFLWRGWSCGRVVEVVAFVEVVEEPGLGRLPAQ
jgi:hypothetical protein